MIKHTFTPKQIAELHAAYAHIDTPHAFGMQCLESILRKCSAAALNQVISANIRHVSDAAKKIQNNA